MPLFTNTSENGFETLKEIKNDSETAAIPVCLMSGTVSDELKDKAILSGAIGLIEKPLQLPQLLSEMRRRLPNEKIDQIRIVVH